MARQCEICEKEMPAHKTDRARFCGRPCMQKNFRNNHPEKAMEWYWNNRDRALAGLRERRSGASPEQYESAFASQKGRCAICGIHQIELKRALSSDHDHDTGDFLGLLCGRCNTGLGMFGDDITNLRAAVEYYEERGRC